MSELRIDKLEFRSPIAVYRRPDGTQVPLYFTEVWQRRLTAVWELLSLLNGLMFGPNLLDATAVPELKALAAAEPFMTDDGINLLSSDQVPPAAQSDAGIALDTLSPPDELFLALDPAPVSFNATIVIRDTAANQANYPAAAFADGVYIATDTLIWYYSDGTNWVQVGAFDDAYGAGWNGSTKAPSQNAVYDKIESVVAGIPSVPTLAHGTYTPALTNVANVAASTAYECQYLRVGNTVVVSGRVDLDPTLAATSTQLGIALPVASNFGATEDCGGAAFASGIAGQGAAIRADAANDRAEMVWISGDITNQPMFFSFAYQVI